MGGIMLLSIKVKENNLNDKETIFLYGKITSFYKQQHKDKLSLPSKTNWLEGLKSQDN